MAVWNDLSVTTVPNDTLSGNVAANLGKEQFFQTSANLSVGLLSSPRKFRFRLHKSITSTAGTLLGALGSQVLTACSLRERLILAPSLVALQTGNGIVLGDTGTFNLVGSLLGMVNAQIYLHQKILLKNSGSAGNSAINSQGIGQIYPASGVPTVGISMPLGIDLTSVDCSVPQQLFIGITFGALTGANSIMLNSITGQYTD